MLFIGESPPASGLFFYSRDSGLYRATLAAFQEVDPAIYEENFLATFEAAGCYLIDLCGEPVDDLPPAARRAACLASERSLSRSIAQLQPVVIVTLVRSIERNVLRAASQVAWRGPYLHLPYPGRWSRLRDVFVSALVPAIHRICDK
jgi:hypothetical protein